MFRNPDLTVVPVRSPSDLLALLPYLIGFVPVDSLVAVAVDDGQIVLAGRIDLPTEPHRQQRRRCRRRGPVRDRGA